MDAPTATLAQQTSIEMLEARRSGQDYFLLHDPASLQGNRESILRLQQTLSSIRDLQPEEQSTIENLLNERRISQQRFEVAVSGMAESGQEPIESVRTLVRATKRT